MSLICQTFFANFELVFWEMLLRLEQDFRTLHALLRNPFEANRAYLRLRSFLSGGGGALIFTWGFAARDLLGYHWLLIAVGNSVNSASCCQETRCLHFRWFEWKLPLVDLDAVICSTEKHSSPASANPVEKFSTKFQSTIKAPKVLNQQSSKVLRFPNSRVLYNNGSKACRCCRQSRRVAFAIQDESWLRVQVLLDKNCSDTSCSVFTVTLIWEGLSKDEPQSIR